PSYTTSSSTHHPSLHSFPTRRSSDLHRAALEHRAHRLAGTHERPEIGALVGIDRGRHRDDEHLAASEALQLGGEGQVLRRLELRDRKSTRLNSSHLGISYAVFCLKKK